MEIPEFKDPQLLQTALTHRSALNEPAYKGEISNERLEYLGDAVLELITSDFLYHKLPHEPEGVLTAVRSGLVKATTLAAVGRDLDLGTKIRLSFGEEKAGGRANDTLLADTVEAVIGALYLDQGMKVTKKFVAQTVLTRFAEILATQSYRDAKSRLQEEVQAMGFATPFYQLESEDGPDHDKLFTVSAIIAGEQFGVGEGKSKQAAQQAAAEQALLEFRQRGNCLKPHLK